MIKKTHIHPLSELLKRYGDPLIELQIEASKNADLDKIKQTDEFKQVIGEACKWVHYYFLFHLEKAKPFFADKFEIKIHRAFLDYDAKAQVPELQKQIPEQKKLF